MEIIKERLEREFNLSLISTAPTVRYKVVDKNEEYLIDSPSKMPKVFERIEEPFMKVSIIRSRRICGRNSQTSARNEEEFKKNSHT